VTGQTAYVFKSVIPRKTDRLFSTHPLLAKWAIGAIAYQTSLGEYPVISNIAFQCYRSELEELEALLDPLKPITINEHIYYPTGRTVEETPYKNTVKVTCGFRSQFSNHPTRSQLDQPFAVYLKTFVESEFFLYKIANDPNKKVAYVVSKFGEGLKRATPYFTLAEAAKAVGVPLTGEEIKVWNDTPKNVREVLDSDRLINNKCFARYDRGAVEIVKWDDVATHTISEDEIRDERVTYSYKGQGYSLNGVPLLRELNYVRLTWHPDPFAVYSLPITTTDQQQQDQGGGNEIVITISGDESPTYPPDSRFSGSSPSGEFSPPPDDAFSNGYDKLRSPGQNFDSGGPTKKRVTTTTRNKSPITEVEEIFGYSYSSMDTYDWYPNLVDAKTNGFYFAYRGTSGNWGLVRTITKNYSYSSDGYLERIVTTTKEKTRILKETDSLEAINAYAWYNTIGTPRNIKEDYELRLHALSYYAYGFNPFSVEYVAHSADAIANPSISNDLWTQIGWDTWKTYTSIETFNNVLFSDYYRDVKPPDENRGSWIPPRFVKDRYTQSYGAYVVTDPRSTRKEKKPPLIFGKLSTQEERVEIVDDDNYRVTAIVTNQEGEGLIQSATDRQFSTKKGRPSAASRMESFSGPARPGSEGAAWGTASIYLATTPGLTPSHIVSDVMDFPTCKTLEEAKSALNYKLVKENLDALTCTVNLTHARNFRDGDRVIFRGKSWRIMAITNNQEITADGILRQRSYTVELGYDYGAIPFTIQESKVV
jgi:hypothetical protein